MDGIYHLPNDELEADRLDLQHHLFRLTVGGALHLAPLPPNVHDVLDVGTGTGIWAIEFADENPSANVLGTDLSPIQPTEYGRLERDASDRLKVARVPPNCSFLIDNVEAKWTFDRKFDFIHSRAMVAALRNWPLFLRQAYSQLKPGGYIELQDVCLPAACDDGTAPPDSPTLELGGHMVEAGRRVGFDMRSPARFVDMLRAAGFVDVHGRRYKWPLGPWPKGEREKAIGRWAMQDVEDGLQGGTLGFLTRVLKWPRERVEAFLSEVRNELREQKAHLYVNIYFVYGRRPVDSEPTPTLVDEAADGWPSTDQKIPGGTAPVSTDYAIKVGSLGDAKRVAISGRDSPVAFGEKSAPAGERRPLGKADPVEKVVPDGDRINAPMSPPRYQEALRKAEDICQEYGSGDGSLAEELQADPPAIEASEESAAEMHKSEETSWLDSPTPQPGDSKQLGEPGPRSAPSQTKALGLLGMQEVRGKRA
ncbi:S-adenosyl-L-methionine-dependent methyltransferase [Lineolata rhizophorae]|uniref:S-adenosyl-L-methionine-dependent methyltransferase n=1 Tax=Lineolata rhizophorae TaxID=578093 RepID=A0A6A6PCP1_9PEZI|nr:S-adenosyl-L-methionine-dependent methyltransferase [Lineolata rhizophorae]